MDFFVLEYIKHKMLQKGFKTFGFEPYVVSAAADPVQDCIIEAYNEFFYLVSRELAVGTIIHSDTNVYTINQYFSFQNLAQIQEFTGLIIIESPPATSQFIEFIRVLPN